MPLKMAVALADALIQLRWESGRPRRQQAGLVQPAGKPRFSCACPAMRGSVGSVWIETRSVSIKKCYRGFLSPGPFQALYGGGEVRLLLECHLEELCNYG